MITKTILKNLTLLILIFWSSSAVFACSQCAQQTLNSPANKNNSFDISDMNILKDRDYDKRKNEQSITEELPTCRHTEPRSRHLRGGRSIAQFSKPLRFFGFTSE